jgi:hypothetical protein
VASDTLRQSIRQGSLKEVTLIDASALDRGFDAPAPVKVRRREMSLKVDVPVGQTIENVLNQIRPWAREQGFDEMYVRWTRPRTGGDDENVTASEPERAKINLAQEDIGETLFAKKEFISLKVPLADLCVEPSEEMLNGMLAILQ